MGDIPLINGDGEGFGAEAGAIAGWARLIVHIIHDPLPHVSGTCLLEAALQVIDHSLIRSLENIFSSFFTPVMNGDFFTFRAVQEYVKVVFRQIPNGGVQVNPVGFSRAY